jgi:hypothetical protein
MDIVDLLYGPGQMDISSWIQIDHFRRFVGDATAKTVKAFDQMLKRGRIKKPEQISLLASGLEFIDKDSYRDAIMQTKQKMESEVGISIQTDFSHLGASVAWAYGGLNGSQYQEPTALKYMEQ